MSFDPQSLAALIAARGPVARVVVANIAGSVPREVGAAMLVWPGGQEGTIGGGALEFQAAERAVAALHAREDRFDRVPLGPGVGQCCGGRVDLLTEVWTAERLATVDDAVLARPCPGRNATPGLAVQRVISQARGQGAVVKPHLIDGWMIEPLSQPTRPLWIYGAGHVGRAIVDVLAPVPEIAITWVDTASDRFPDTVADKVTKLIAVNPADVVAHAPAAAEHLILTYSHAFDLEICHRLLAHGFAHAGLIGSQTKWARFRKRLAALGHGPDQIARITCPIGDPSLGKHPQAIAIGVAGAVLQQGQTAASTQGKTG
ncbi:MAG: xanthine dehydrogenase accessory protein XdhC [Pseudomonadota bacterium]